MWNHSRCWALIAVLTMAADLPATAGDCDQWAPGPFAAAGPIGTDGVVLAVTRWDPDGAGPSPEWLVIGGAFSHVQGVSAKNIAMFSSVTGQWRAAGSGIEGKVHALAVLRGELIAGGTFSIAGGQPANNVARFDGAGWYAMGFGVQLNDTGESGVYALLEHDGMLIAAGDFQGADDWAAPDLVMWNGQFWTNAPFWPVSGGAPVSSTSASSILCLASTPEHLYVGGSFGVKRWAWFGEWSELPDNFGFTGVSGPVTSIVPTANAQGVRMVMVGGTFGFAGIQRCHNAAVWSELNQWYAVPGLSSPVTCMSRDEHGEIVAASFDGESGAIQTFNSVTWAWNQATSVAIAGSAQCMMEFHGWFVVCGALTSIGEQVNANGIARRVAESWLGFGGQTATSVRALHVFGPRLLVGGDFQQYAAPGVPASGLVTWDGVLACVPGLGESEVRDIYSRDLADGSGNHELVIARATWPHVVRATLNPDAATFQPAFMNMGPPNGPDQIPGAVNAIESFNEAYFMCGEFDWNAGRRHIARWDGAAWTQVLGGLNANANALKTFQGALYVGGEFSAANSGAVRASRLARWDGVAWSAVHNAAFDGVAVQALEVFQGRLIVGGVFAGPANSPNIAAFNGASVTAIGPLGRGGANGAVRSLKTVGDRLYVGGDFTVIDGVPANRLAYWDGQSWHAVPGGANGSILAIERLGDCLHIGGMFDCVDGSALSAVIWAQFDSCPGCFADVNDDGLVNVTDLLAVIGAWGACPPPGGCAADVNGDDVINVTDLLAVIGAWGACP